MSLPSREKAGGASKSSLLQRAYPAAVLAVFVLVLTSAAFQRFALPLTPVFDPDSPGYLGPALSVLAGGPMMQFDERAFFYPAILLAVLKVTGSFSSIVVFQHAVSLACGVVWMAIWWSWMSILPKNRSSFYLAPWIGLAGVAFYLWSSETIFFGMQVRPESVFPLFASMQLYCQMIYIRSRWPAERGDAAGWKVCLAGAGALLFAVMAYYLKPSWGLAVLTSPLLLLAGLFFRRGAISPVATASSLVLGGLLVLLFVSALPRALKWVPQRESGTFLPMHLFSVHADIIVDDMKKKISSGLAAPDEIRFAGKLELAIKEGRARLGPYQLLGHNPDYLMYGSSALADLPGVTNNRQRQAFYVTSYLESLRHFPDRYFRKWLVQMRSALMPDSKFMFRPTGKLQKLYRISSDYQMLPPPTLRQDLVQGLESVATETRALASCLPEKTQTVPGWLKLAGEAGSVLVAASLGLCFVSLAAVPFCLKSHTCAVLSAALILASFLLSSFTVALVHSFDIDRYVALQSWIAWLVIACGTALFFSLAETLFQRAVSGIKPLPQN
ncbi:MAG: hypothetical protein D4R65_10640 [Verrucomicrobiaceae bacterium]|nr:MAG: hypothetical protein D4R65_10640 [Verrucomicrobiaceae bacterium]